AATGLAAVLGAAVGALSLALLAAGVSFTGGAPRRVPGQMPTPAESRAEILVGGAASPVPSLNPSQSSAVERGIADLRAFPPVTPATSSRYPAIAAGTKTQPDVYAAAFAVQLLTQDYRAPRAELLCWIQSE